MRTISRHLPAVLCTVLMLDGAMAAPVVFTASDAGAGITDPRPNADASAAAFDAAAATLGTARTITFESATVGTFTTLTAAPGVTVTGGNAANPPQPQSIQDTPQGASAAFGYDTTAGGSHFLYLEGGTATFTFATPIDAFGAFVTGVQELSTETITFSDGSLQTVSISNPDPARGGALFVGFTDAGQAISSLTIFANIDAVGIDDVRYVSAAPGNVPEPGTGLLIAAGALAILTRRRTNAT
jgi:hypothetical protein